MEITVLGSGLTTTHLSPRAIDCKELALITRLQDLSQVKIAAETLPIDSLEQPRALSQETQVLVRGSASVKDLISNHPETESDFLQSASDILASERCPQLLAIVCGFMPIRQLLRS